MKKKPFITTDGAGCEYVHPERPIYYLHQHHNGMWCVIDRKMDLQVTENFKSKRGALSHFMRRWERYADGLEDRFASGKTITHAMGLPEKLAMRRGALGGYLFSSNKSK